MPQDLDVVTIPGTPPATGRVQLAPSSGGRQHLDGGWWPRSTDLAEELPDLLAAVSDRVGHVAVVGYPRQAWAPAPERIDTDGGEVRLQGYNSDDPQTIVVIGERGHAVSLLVIPPETPAVSAVSELRDVCAGADPPPAERAEERHNDRSLEAVAARLSRHAGQGAPPAAVIAEWVHEAAAQFTEVPIQGFVPILVQHIVRDRIVAARRTSSS